MKVLQVTEDILDKYSEKGIVVQDYKRVSDDEIIRGIELKYKNDFPNLVEVEVEFLKLPFGD